MAIDLPRSRSEAMGLGSRHYFSGKPCKRGHVDIRHTDGHCTECKREDGAKRLEQNGEWVRAAWRKFYAANRERRVALVVRQQRENPELSRARTSTRRARKLGAEGKYTKDDVATMRRLQGDKCAYCKIRLKGKGVVDHIVPLTLGGSNWPNNLQLTCHSCNCSKGPKLPEQFSRQRGMLL